jgi:hypothetical protein
VIVCGASSNQAVMYTATAAVRPFGYTCVIPVDGLIARGDYEQAIPHVHRWLELDPLHEPAHRELIRLYAWNGDRGGALEQYRECVRTLSQELGVAPVEETATLYDQVSEGTLTPPSEADAPPALPTPAKLGEPPAEVLARARALGFDALATGHYARVEDGRLYRGADAAKDQSYVLYMLGPAELERLRLPLGRLTKPEVRATAARLGLRTAAKPESYDVCFVPDGDTAGWLERRFGPRPGQVVDTAGRVLGHHRGAYRYTVGQRRGIGVAGAALVGFEALDAGA